MCGLDQCGRPGGGLVGDAAPLKAASVDDLVSEAENGTCEKNVQVRGAWKAAEFADVALVGSSVPFRICYLLGCRCNALDPNIVGFLFGNK